MIKKHYIDTSFGQIHARTLNTGDSSIRPLVLLHPMPYSSLYFTTFMPLIDSRRAVIAIDYPGCGHSENLNSAPTIETYAQASIEVLDAMEIEGPCDFVGFHTGCLVAAELAASTPSRVAAAILIDIPFFDEAKRLKFIDSQTSHKLLTEELACLKMHWDADVKTRVGIVSIERAVELFADHISAKGDGAEGFKAAFRYKAEETFAAMDCLTLIIATKSGLYEGTLAAAKLIKGSELIEMTDITRAVFEEGAEKIAGVINSWGTN